MDIALWDRPRIEYLDGRPHPKVSPQTAHAAVQGALLAILRGCGRGRGLAGTELRVYPAAARKTDTSLIPDVSFVARERMASLGSRRQRNKPPFSPDIAIEVRSPSDDLQFLREKIARYLSTGSTLVLDVDPETRTIVAHAGDGVRRFTRGQRFAHAAAAWLTFEVDDVFTDLDEYGL